MESNCCVEGALIVLGVPFLIAVGLGLLFRIFFPPNDDYTQSGRYGW